MLIQKVCAAICYYFVPFTDIAFLITDTVYSFTIPLNTNTASPGKCSTPTKHLRLLMPRSRGGAATKRERPAGRASQPPRGLNMSNSHLKTRSTLCVPARFSPRSEVTPQYYRHFGTRNFGTFRISICSFSNERSEPTSSLMTFCALTVTYKKSYVLPFDPPPSGGSVSQAERFRQAESFRLALRKFPAVVHPIPVHVPRGIAGVTQDRGVDTVSLRPSRPGPSAVRSTRSASV